METIIGLPGKLLPNITIPLALWVVRRPHTAPDPRILFIDASKQFKRVGNKNKLLAGNQEAILRALKDRVDIEYAAHLVSNEDVAAADYNLSVSSHVEAEDTREVIDIDELNAEIARIVARQSVLRTEIDAIVADLEATK